MEKNNEEVLASEYQKKFFHNFPVPGQKPMNRKAVGIGKLGCLTLSWVTALNNIHDVVIVSFISFSARFDIFGKL